MKLGKQIQTLMSLLSLFVACSLVLLVAAVRARTLYVGAENESRRIAAIMTEMDQTVQMEQGASQAPGGALARVGRGASFEELQASLKPYVWGVPRIAASIIWFGALDFWLMPQSMAAGDLALYGSAMNWVLVMTVVIFLMYRAIGRRVHQVWTALNKLTPKQRLQYSDLGGEFKIVSRLPAYILLLVWLLGKMPRWGFTVFMIVALIDAFIPREGIMREISVHEKERRIARRGGGKRGIRSLIYRLMDSVSGLWGSGAFFLIVLGAIVLIGILGIIRRHWFITILVVMLILGIALNRLFARLRRRDEDDDYDTDRESSFERLLHILNSTTPGGGARGLNGRGGRRGRGRRSGRSSSSRSRSGSNSSSRNSSSGSSRSNQGSQNGGSSRSQSSQNGGSGRPSRGSQNGNTNDREDYYEDLYRRAARYLDMDEED